MTAGLITIGRCSQFSVYTAGLRAAQVLCFAADLLTGGVDAGLMDQVVSEMVNKMVRELVRIGTGRADEKGVIFK